MRTTVDIDSDILKELKKAAAKGGVSLRETVNSTLRAGLQRGGKTGQRKAYTCPTFSMGQPTGNLDKALTLSDVLEDSELARELGLRK